MNKDFVLRTVDLALSRHRWDELGYDPPFAQDYLRRFRRMVEGFDPSTAVPRSRGFPAVRGRGRRLLRAPPCPFLRCLITRSVSSAGAIMSKMSPISPRFREPF